MNIVMHPFLILGALLLAGVSAASGYMFSRRDALSVLPRPSETVSPSPSPSVSPEPASGSSLPTLRPSPVVRGLATVSPEPATPTPSPTPSVDVRVRFVDLPSHVRSGQSFTIRWQVEGPSGAFIEKTTLETRTATSSNGSGGNASSSSTSKNTFGGVSSPHTFSTTLTFGGDARSVTLVVNATVNGAVVTAPSVTLPIQ